MNIEKIIIRPQTCDMGSGFGKFEFEENTTLKDFLEFYKHNSKTWGNITIRKKDGKILRVFDYNTYNDNIFYYHLNWELDDKLKEVNFDYCFMNENVEIILK